MSVCDHLLCESFLHEHGNAITKLLVVPRLFSLGHQFLALSDEAELLRD